MEVDIKQFEKFEVLGAQRKDIVAKIFKQVGSWGLQLPDVPDSNSH